MEGMVGEGLLRALAREAGNEAWLTSWRSVAWLGSAAFYSALIPLFFAATPRRWALRLVLLFAASATLAEALKQLFGRSRPDLAALGVTESLEHAGAFENAAFPSGHALMAVVVWGFLLLRSSRLWVRGIACLGILAISASRLALLRHDLLDVLGGWGFGIVLLGILHQADRRWGASLSRLPSVEQAGLWLLLPVVCQLALGLEVTAIVLGVAAGLGMGAVLSPRTRANRPAVISIVARAILGLAGAVGARALAAPGGEWPGLALFGIYALAGLWVAGVVPALLGGSWVTRWD